MTFPNAIHVQYSKYMQERFRFQIQRKVGVSGNLMGTVIDNIFVDDDLRKKDKRENTSPCERTKKNLKEDLQTNSNGESLNKILENNIDWKQRHIPQLLFQAVDPTSSIPNVFCM
ncbi:hypothetical protein CHS0354_028354, partial [Potamilus streckersoni]